MLCARFAIMLCGRLCNYVMKYYCVLDLPLCCNMLVVGYVIMAELLAIIYSRI